MPSLHHEVRVAAVLETHPHAKREGFRAWARDLYNECEPGPDAEDPKEVSDWNETRAYWLENLAFRPDLWEYLEEKRIVTCWEVHVYGNPESKIGQYIEAMWALDELGPYKIRLIHVDAFGREIELDLRKEWGRREDIAKGNEEEDGD
jgi:hypothetical protein